MKHIGRNLAVAAAGAVALAACGNPIAKLSTEQAVGNAMGALLDQPGLTMKVSLGLTPQQLRQLDAAGGHGTLTAQQATALAASDVYIDVLSGNGEQLKNPQFFKDGKDQVEIAVQVNQTSPIDFRFVGRSLYLKVDTATLSNDFGEAGKANSFGSSLSKANSYVPGIDALGQGKWVTLPVSAFAPLLGGLKSQLTTSTTTAAESQQMIAALRSAFTDNATYTNSGDHGGRTEYTLTVAARNFVQQAVSALANTIPGGQSLLNVTQSINKFVSKIPADQKVAMQLWVSQNKAQEIDIDVRQFDPKLPFAVPVRVMLGGGSPVSAPQGATSLDLSKITQLLGGLMTGLGKG